MVPRWRHGQGGDKVRWAAQTDCVREKTTTLVWSPHQSLFLISSRCTVSTTFPFNRSDTQCQLSAVNGHYFVSTWLMNLLPYRVVRPMERENWKAGLYLVGYLVHVFLCVGVRWDIYFWIPALSVFSYLLPLSLSLSLCFCLFSFFNVYTFTNTHTHKHTCQLPYKQSSYWVNLHNEHLSPLMDESVLRAQIFSNLFYSNTGIIFQNILISSSPLSINDPIWVTSQTEQSYYSNRIIGQKLCSKSWWATLLSAVYKGSSFHWQHHNRKLHLWFGTLCKKQHK